jgi:hypothetical protein
LDVGAFPNGMASPSSLPSRDDALAERLDALEVKLEEDDDD